MNATSGLGSAAAALLATSCLAAAGEGIRGHAVAKPDAKKAGGYLEGIDAKQVLGKKAWIGEDHAAAKKITDGTGHATAKGVDKCLCRRGIATGSRIGTFAPGCGSHGRRAMGHCS